MDQPRLARGVRATCLIVRSLVAIWTASVSTVTASSVGYGRTPHTISVVISTSRFCTQWAMAMSANAIPLIH